MAHDFKLSVNAIIINNDQVLLVKREDRNMWRIPGGEINLGETIDEALIRIIMSKLNIKISIQRVIGLYSKPIQNELVVSFAVELESDPNKYKVAEDYVAADYFSLANLPDNLPDKNYERIEDFKNNYKEVVIRTQMSAPSSLKFPKIKN